MALLLLLLLLAPKENPEDAAPLLAGAGVELLEKEKLEDGVVAEEVP